MKKVADFREDIKGLYIDLEDQFSSLAVNRQTGDLLLDEGDGNDRFNGAIILQQLFPQFVTRPHRGKLDIWLEYGKDHCQKRKSGQVSGYDLHRFRDKRVCLVGEVCHVFFFERKTPKRDPSPFSLSPFPNTSISGGSG